MIRIGYIDKNFLKEEKFCPTKFQENIDEKNTFYFESVCDKSRRLFKLILVGRALHLDYKTSLYYEKFYKICGKKSILELDLETKKLNYLMISAPLDE